MGGWGIAGILTVALRAATKAAFPDSSDGLRQSARIYFFSATLVCLSCLLVQRWVIVPSSVWTADLSMLEEGDPLLLDISSDRSGSIDVEGPWWRTVKKTRLASANTFITLFILSVMFPGVASDAEVFRVLPSLLIRPRPVLRTEQDAGRLVRHLATLLAQHNKPCWPILSDEVDSEQSRGQYRPCLQQTAADTHDLLCDDVFLQSVRHLLPDCTGRIVKRVRPRPPYAICRRIG